MFTGIIEAVGVVRAFDAGAKGGRVLTVKSELPEASLKLGDSIACSGVCLTVTRLMGASFTVEVGPETLERTTLDGLRPGGRINLERALAVGDRLGGHIVSGHVDGVGRLLRVEPRENAYDLEIEAPGDILPLIAPRGSITVDGISLTVTQVKAGSFGVSIIPHTWQVTTLHERRVSDRVNLEADVLARHVARLLQFPPSAG